MIRQKRAQTTAEYALLVAVAVAALLAMQVYVKRGAQGRLKSAADQMGEQFAPLKYTSGAATSFKAKRDENVEASGRSTSTIQGEEVQKRDSGQEHITAPLSDENKLF